MIYHLGYCFNFRHAQNPQIAQLGLTRDVCLVCALMFNQLPQLLAICPPPLIHVHDPNDQILYNPALDSVRAAQRAFVLIDCVECISQRVLFARVINGLANWTPRWSDAGECWGGNSLGAWDSSFDTFSKALKTLWQSIVDSKADRELDGGGNESMVVMLKNSEYFKETLPSLFVPFTRLSELVSVSETSAAFISHSFSKTGTPSCVIFISQCSWTALRPPLGSSPTPFLCTIPPLTVTQITNSLISIFPTKRSKRTIHPYNPRLRPLYEQFIQALYAACSPTTNDPAQLAYVASARWPGFVAPLLNDWRAIESAQLEVDDGTPLDTDDFDVDERFPIPSTADTLRLLHTFKPTFIPALNTLLPRLTTAQAWSEINTPPENVRLSQPLTLSLPALSTSSGTNLAGPSEQADARLKGTTTRTRILLLASYVASFNPARTDAKLFERTAEGVATRARRKRRTAGGSPKKTPIKPSGPTKVRHRSIPSIHPYPQA